MIRFSKLDTIMVCSEEIWLSELIFVIFLGLEQYFNHFWTASAMLRIKDRNLICTDFISIFFALFFKKIK